MININNNYLCGSIICFNSAIFCLYCESNFICLLQICFNSFLCIPFKAKFSALILNNAFLNSIENSHSNVPGCEKCGCCSCSILSYSSPINIF